MAGDWIKVETTTPDKPEVVLMAEKLGLDQDAVTGKLIRVWSWANQNSLDGENIRVTTPFLDRLTNCPGFAVAMREAGWLEGRDAALSLPAFARHNGQSAKARSESARRMARSRCAKSATHAQPKPQPEKRREEVEDRTPNTGAKPTLEEVRAFEQQQLPPHDLGFAAWWHNSQEGAGWVDSKNRPVVKWKPAYQAARSSNRHAAQERTERQKSYGSNQKPTAGRDRNAGTANEGRANAYRED